MNTNTPKGLALVVAAIMAVVVELVLISVGLIYEGWVNWLFLLVSLPIFIGAGYVVFLLALENFVHKKIRLIYKTIHSKKRASAQHNNLDIGSDILSEVNEDVANWARQQELEIQELKLAEEYRREFVGNVAHELKTPLFTCQGYILTLIEGGLHDEAINEKYLRRAEKSIERLIGIVEDLDNITQLEAGQLKLNLEKTDVVELANEVAEASELIAKDQNITIKFRRRYDPIHVVADKGRIKQVLSNVISNSIKYGKAGGTSEIRFYDMDEYILVEIADDGPGINEQHLPRLFERFYRVEESRSRDKGGSGLGLAIVKHIIEAHNQTINVRSTEGLGSSFSFTLKKA